MPTTTTTTTQVPHLQIHVLESTEQFENLSVIDDTALYFTPFDMIQYAADDDVVHDTGDEEINGVKTFGTGIIVPEQEDLTNAEDCNVATIQYVDDYGGQVDGVEITFNEDSDLHTVATITADNNGRRIASLDVSLDYVGPEEPVFTGVNPPSFLADGEQDSVLLATQDDITITDVTINNQPSNLISIDEDKLMNIDLTSYVEMMPVQSPAQAQQVTISNATLFNGKDASFYATKNDLDRYVLLTDNRLTNTREPAPHNHDLTTLKVDNTAQSPQSLSSYLTATFAPISHNHSTLVSGGLTVGLPSGITGNQTVVLTSQLNSKITYGTSEMTPGTSNLATGCLYFQYEA